MQVTQSHISLVRLRGDLFRKSSAILLFFLLSVSFVVENNIFCEGEKVERVGGSEKEVDHKEKKLLLFSLDLPSLRPGTTDALMDKFATSSILDGIHPDIQTPPPRLVYHTTTLSCPVDNFVQCHLDTPNVMAVSFKSH